MSSSITSVTYDLVIGSQLAATFVMLGVIWVVQLLVYPSFATVAARVSAEEWMSYHARHAGRITWIVGPAMLVEAVGALWLVIDPATRVPVVMSVIGVGCVALIWITTILVASSHHARLAQAPDLVVIQRLVRINWIRTIAWSVRAVLVVAIAISV